MKTERIYKAENTCISTRHSKSAEVVAEMAKETRAKKVLDYGCGMGRNINFMMEQVECEFAGSEIVEQLEKEKENHDSLREKGCTIVQSSELNGEYDIALNSHVLNVIDDDKIKQSVIDDIFENLRDGGKAVIEVRTKSDVEGAKTKEKYGDGYLIKKGSSYTYQEAITKEKMDKLVTNAGFKIIKHICNSSRHMVIAEK